MKRFFIALKDWCKKLPQNANHPWYPYALALIAFADYFIFVIPLDAMVVASVMAARHRWLSITIWSSIGSTLGAGVFAVLIHHFGPQLLDSWAPHLLEDHFAVTITHWLQNYGFWALVVVAMMPIHQHPTVAIASLANVSIGMIVISMFLGRQLKYCIYTWISGHAQNRLAGFFKKK